MLNRGRMANRLKEWRESQQPALSKAEFAARIGVSERTLNHYECDFDNADYRIPRMDLMVRIFEATGGAVGPEHFYPLPAPPADGEAAA